MGKLMRNMLLQAKEQTAKGTPATLAPASNAILVRSAGPQLISGDFVKRDLIRGAMGNYGSDLSGAYRSIEFEVEFAGSGAAGTKPGQAPLLLGCRMSETVTAGVSVAYQPATSSPKYLTIECDLDGVLFRLTDAIGTVSLTMDAGAYPVLKYSFIGVYEALTDRTMPTGAVFSTQLKPLVVNKINTPTMTIGGIAFPTASFSMDMAGDVYWRELVNEAGASMNDRTPVARMRLELGTVAQKNWGEAVRLGEELALAITHGLTAGNIVTVAAPKLQVNAAPTISDDRGVAMLDLSFDVKPNAGNDEFVWTFR